MTWRVLARATVLEMRNFFLFCLCPVSDTHDSVDEDEHEDRKCGVGIWQGVCF